MHYRALVAFARKRVHSMDAASDLVHDAFVKVASLSAPDDVRQPRAFFVRVIENLLIDRFREGRSAARTIVDVLRHGDDNDVLMDLAVEPVDPCQQVMASQTAMALDLAVNALPARCREVFLLRKVHDLSHEAIAERLGISRNMVEKHLRRALMGLVGFSHDEPHGISSGADRAGSPSLIDD
jgi:RNA polymerase sigma-70 factor (ECF subfamily)